ncbi:MAG: hypothetical protein RLZZ385_2280 [Pseudomonadota bacterium]
MKTGKDGVQPAADLVITAPWIIPVVPAGVVLADYAVVIHDKQIVELLPRAIASAQYGQAPTVQLDNHVLIPGLINSHGHSPMALLRGAADDIPLKQWLEDRIWPLESSHVSASFVRHGAELAIAEMLLSGTTCFADMYFFPDQVAQVATAAHMRVQLASPVLDFPTAWAADPEEYILKATQLHDSYRTSELVHTAFGPHAPYTVSDGPLRKIAVLAEELDIPIHMHVHETAQEVSDALTATGKRPLARLADLGLLTPRLLCVHATQLLAGEIAELARTGCHVVHCPESNLKLASGFCPTAALRAAGVNVALGTDGCASNNDLDMFGEMRTAALLAKAVAGDASAMPAFAMLETATINGARALGLEDRIGSLEPGKYADLAAVSMDAINASPVYHPVSHLVYSTHASQISHVWIGGRPVVQDGELLTLDRRNVMQMARDWQLKISAGLKDS